MRQYHENSLLKVSLTQEFSSTQLFEHQNSEEGMVRMFVNGEENTEFENYRMRDGDAIEIRYE